ncbi:SMP-30/gluconolactonase/LRE family protein [Caballeronia sp. S22]|uniref:SMP-30/gluconolactonase/LRE family protein n=1 Tax=Caballeronia sp. S22 TaxID=3137182 RepID=UPI0035305FDD
MMPTSHSVRLLVDARNSLGESPLWCPRSQALWWIDVQQPSLWQWDHATGATKTWPLPKPPGNISLLEGGGLLVAYRKGLAVLREPDMHPEPLRLGEFEFGDERFNDGKVDRLGRLWVGSFDRSLERETGRLYRADASMSIRAVDTGFGLSNGIGWSSDSSTLYFADTHAQCIYRYAFDLKSGEACDRDVFVEFRPGPGGPDGLTVDAEGGVWCALFDRGRVDRYSADGTLDLSVELPVSRPTSCTIGGPRMRTLFITTARMGIDEEALTTQSGAGGVFCLEIGQRGLLGQPFAPSTDLSARQARQ